MKPTTLVTVLILGVGLTASILLFFGGKPVAKKRLSYVPRPAGSVTFNREIAPILFQNCATCHRPGGAGPFSLTTYAESQKRAGEIAEVTARRYMPPWLPEPGYGEFHDQRLLREDQIGLIGQWAKEGAIEGEAKDLPALPQWPAEWQSGTPDLVVKMTLPFLLSANGKDIYRNFVVPLPINQRKQVRAVEYRPGTKAVHHVFMRIDRTAHSRSLDAQDAEPGFPGMDSPSSAQGPEGQFLSWQPGKIAAKSSPGLAWGLEPGSDFILQTHLQPTGKPETLQARVGFYFTDEIATNSPFKIRLGSYAIDIPAGTTNYQITDSLKLPVDAEVIAILPHAHFLARKMEGFATLPDGSRQWLLLINQWDFNWQGDYRYKSPVFLPAGSTVQMKFTYDNSTNNPHNPHRPPQRVRFGMQSIDEMGELWLQFLVRSPADGKKFSQSYQGRVVQDVIAYNQYRLEQNPKDPFAFNNLGQANLARGEVETALKHFQSALELKPDFDEPHYYLGLIWRGQKKIPEAIEAFQKAIRLNPENSKAYGNLGLVLLQQGRIEEAEQNLKQALRINPQDAIARETLQDIAKARGVPSP